MVVAASLQVLPEAVRAVVVAAVAVVVLVAAVAWAILTAQMISTVGRWPVTDT